MKHNFNGYGICQEQTRIARSLILGYLQQKVIIKSYENSMLSPFANFRGNKDFSEKSTSVTCFLDFYRAKFQKEINRFQEKLITAV